ncbi:ABC transporter substrate-binding protein [Nitrospinota bacterium]
MVRKINRRQFLRGVGGAGAAAAVGWLHPVNAEGGQGVFRFAASGQPRSLDPAHTITTGDSLARTWANGLLRFKPGSGDPTDFEMDLATKWDVSNGGKTYTFQIRKGVQIHGGKGELTSADVKWTFDRMKDKKLRSMNRGRYVNIDGIETPDRYTVRFHLKELDGLFLNKMLNYRGGYIVAKVGVKDDLGLKMRWSPPLATGPFMIKKFEPKVKIILERHDQYFRGRPRIKRYEYYFIRSIHTRILSLKKGELDASYVGTLPRRLLETLKADPNIEVDIPDSAYNSTLHFNLTMKPMDDKRVRQAIAYAINRKEIVNLFAPMARPLYGPVAPICVGGLQVNEVPEKYRYTYNPEKAKALLKEAGYGSGLRLETIAGAAIPHVAKPLEVIQQHLAQVGIQLKIHTSDTPGYLKGSRGDKYPVNIYGGKRFPHAYDYLLEWYHTRSDVTKPTRMTNISRYGAVGRNVDKLIDEAGRISDKKRQVELLKKAQFQILEDLPTYPLFTPLLGIARRKNVDLGFKFSDTSVYNYPLTEKSVSA